MKLCERFFLVTISVSIMQILLFNWNITMIMAYIPLGFSVFYLVEHLIDNLIKKAGEN